MNSARRASFLILFLCFYWSGASLAAEPELEFSGTVSAATGVTKELVLGGPARYLLRVKQDEIDLQVGLTLENQPSIAINSVTGMFGEEYIAFETGHETLASITLSAADQPGVSGNYQVEIMPVPAASAERWQAMQLLTETGALGLERAEQNRETSIDLLLRAEKLLDDVADARLKAHAMHQIAFNAYWLLRLEKAETYFRAASSLYGELHNYEMQSVANIDLAATIMEAQRFEEAETLFSMEIGRAQRSGDPIIEAYARNHFGLMHYYKDELDRAEAQFNSAKSIYQSVNQTAKVAQVHANIALLTDQRGALRYSRQLYVEALAMLPPESNQWLRAIFNTNIASVERRLGNVNSALVRLGDARSAYEEIKDYAGLAWTLSGIANIYRSIGRPFDALRFQEQAVELRRSRDESGGLANALLRLGDDYRQEGLEAESSEYLELALRTHQDALRHSGNDRHRARAVVALIKDNLELGNISEAEVLRVRATQLLENVNDIGLQLNLAIALADFPGVDQPELEEELRRSIELAHEYENGAKVAEALAALARVVTNEEEATQLNFAALALLEEERAKIANPWLQTYLSAYEYPIVEQLLHSMYLRSDDTASALQLTLDYRARAFNALIQDLESAVSGTLPEKSMSEYREAYESYREALQLPRNLDTRESRIDATLNSIEVARARMRIEQPGYAETFYPDPVSADSVRNVLALDEFKNTLILLYFVGEAHGFVWSIDRANTRLWKLPGERELHHKIAGLSAAIENLNATPYSELTSRTRELSDILIPSELSFDDVEKLVVIPDGSIGAVPFAALYMGDDESERFLVEEVAVSMYPSLPGVPGAMKSVRSGRTTVIANESRLFTFDDRNSPVAFDLIRSESLTTEELDAVLTASEGIHIASHAWVHPTNPSLSGFELSGDGNSGAMYTLADIYRLRMRANLVFLSACETSLGEVIHGEGAQSLVRGFLYAGAKNVVSTAWRVDERGASEFARLFYDSLAASAPGHVSEVLRRTQLKMMKENLQWRHPYYWAGYQLTRN